MVSYQKLFPQKTTPIKTQTKPKHANTKKNKKQTQIHERKNTTAHKHTNYENFKPHKPGQIAKADLFHATRQSASLAMLSQFVKPE